jgi:mRNA interferase YafQ
MFRIITTNSFDKEVVKCIKRGLNLDLLQKAIFQLEIDGLLPPSYKPHVLSGKDKGHWECHVKPDWLLIWLQDNKEKIITLVATGTHSDLFK